MTEARMNVVVVVGNPKPKSRTGAAAVALARAIDASCEIEVVDLAELGAGLLQWGDARVDRAKKLVAGCDLAIFASPTYKGSYTGLLKLFLDQIASGNGLESVVAIPFMVGGSPGHQMAPEVFLKPVLVELGAVCPTPAVYVTEATLGRDDMAEAWLVRWKGTITDTVGLTRGRVSTD